MPRKQQRKAYEKEQKSQRGVGDNASEMSDASTIRELETDKALDTSTASIASTGSEVEVRQSIVTPPSPPSLGM